MTDVLKQLLIPSWRGQIFPCTGREYSFRHEHTKHRYVFVDDELVESLGLENPTYRYTIPAREDLARGPWANWFSRYYQDFLAACRDRSSDILIDPVHGEVQAKCASLSETLDVTKRDGVDLTVEFVYAPEDVATVTADIQVTSVAGAEGMAFALDREIEKIDWQQEPPPEPTVDLFDAVRGVGDQIDLAGRRFAAQMANVSSKMEALSDRIDSLARPDLQSIRRQARRLALAAQRLNDQATTPPNPTRVVVLVRDMGLIALSALYKMTVSDLQKLNPTLGRGPTVSANTPVRVYRTKRA